MKRIGSIVGCSVSVTLEKNIQFDKSLKMVSGCIFRTWASSAIYETDRGLETALATD